MKHAYRIIIALILFAAITTAANAQYRIDEKYPGRPTSGTLLTLCGGPVVYIIDADAALSSPDWHTSVIWSWDARSVASNLGLAESRMDHIDDCKLVDNGRKALITSSYGWCVMVDYATGDLLFYSTKTPNAHSADLLPGNLIAVGCSDGTNEGNNTVQLYYPDRSNEKIAEYTFASTHGVVWNDATQRLYVAGARKIGVYRLDGSDTDSPSLVLDYEVTTARSDVHDLLAVNPGKMTIAGKEAYLYDIEQKSFRNIPALLGRGSLKSLNMNPATGEIWYTDMTDTADIRFWFTHNICWLPGRNSSGPAAVINIPDINVYKVRVAEWGYVSTY